MANKNGIEIRFLRDYEVQDENAGTPDAEAYKAGKKTVVSPASASHFISRGAAEMVTK